MDTEEIRKLFCRFTFANGLNDTFTTPSVSGETLGLQQTHPFIKSLEKGKFQKLNSTLQNTGLNEIAEDKAESNNQSSTSIEQKPRPGFKIKTADIAFFADVAVPQARSLRQSEESKKSSRSKRSSKKPSVQQEAQ